MEGPTPVSALIHAATMVTAGVFLVCRCSPMFELAPVALEFVTFIGATTAFFAASVGLFQNDIKRVIAYSTCSQLGYMFVAAGVSAYGAAMFHLFTHAFFKALLFLAAGAVIHAMHHEQDMRKMGGLAQRHSLHLGDDADRQSGADRRRHSVSAASALPASIPRTPSSMPPISPHRHGVLCLHPDADRGRHDLLLFLAPVPDDLPWPLSRARITHASGACRRAMPMTSRMTITAIITRHTLLKKCMNRRW